MGESDGGGCGKRSAITLLYIQTGIDKISSLSCQKVAYSIISSKLGSDVAELTSVLLRNIYECIRHYPSAHGTV